MVNRCGTPCTVRPVRQEVLSPARGPADTCSAPVVKAVCVAGGSQSVARRSPPCLQSLDVPGELRRGRCGDARRDWYVVKSLGKVGQGRGDDLLRFASAERVPVLGFADEVRGADPPVVEAAVDGEREVVVDPAVLRQHPGNHSQRRILVWKHGAVTSEQRTASRDEPRTPGEKMMAAYLDERSVPYRYESFGEGANPDFRADHPVAGEVMLEVYEPGYLLPRNPDGSYRSGAVAPPGRLVRRGLTSRRKSRQAAVARDLTQAHLNTRFSAVAVITRGAADTPAGRSAGNGQAYRLQIFHNPFAAIPLKPEFASPYDSQWAAVDSGRKYQQIGPNRVLARPPRC